MRIWTIFLERMFGVPPRSNCVEDTEEGVKVKSSHAKNIDVYVGGNFGGRSIDVFGLNYFSDMYNYPIALELVAL